MSQTVPTCPYVGLQPYTEAERDYFFGREQDTETIAANLLTAPLTVLYGASGVGKTSVLAAGVAPYLRAMPNVLVVQYRAWQDETFLAALQAEIIHSARAAGWTISETRDLPLDEFLARAARETRCTFLLILDQFEEYFLYHPNATPFDEQFARAVNRDDVNANFLLALREDALSQLDRFETRIPNLMSNGLRLEYLDRAGAERAIRKPLEVYNARRPNEPPFAIEDALVDALIDQVRTGRVTLGLAGQGEVSAPAAARVRIETPFLQMVLTRLWDEETRIGSYALRLETLSRLGGAEKIVRTHLDAVMSKLTAPEQEICATFFDRLVTPSGAKIAQSADDLVTYTARPAARVTPVLKKLDEARVLRPIAPPPQQPHVTRYEIFHDVLAPAILDWRRRFVERKRAADALGKIKDARDAHAVEPLIAALRDSDEWVRSSAVDALRAIAISDARAVESLIAVLRDPDADVRERVVDALEAIGDVRTVEPLIAALRDPDADVRGRAANALGAIKDARAVEPLIAALRDPDADVRERAAGALGQIGDARAVDPLSAALRDSDAGVRQWAAYALEAIGERIHQRLGESGD